MSAAKHTPGPWKPMRKPGARQKAGITMIRGEIEAMIDGMRSYRNPEETRRAALLSAGLDYIDAAIAKATGEA